MNYTELCNAIDRAPTAHFYGGGWSGNGAPLLKRLSEELWLTIMSQLDAWSVLITLGCSCREFQRLALKAMRRDNMLTALPFYNRGCGNLGLALTYKKISKSLLVLRCLIERPQSYEGRQLRRFKPIGTKTVQHHCIASVIYRLHPVDCGNDRIVLADYINACLHASMNVLHIDFKERDKRLNTVAGVLYAIYQKFKELDISVKVHQKWMQLICLKAEDCHKKQRVRKRSNPQGIDKNKRPKLTAAEDSLKISNIVATEGLCHFVDLDALYKAHSDIVQYDLCKFPAAIIKKMPACALVFPRGRCIITGATTMNELLKTSENIKKLVNPFIVRNAN